MPGSSISPPREGEAGMHPTMRFVELKTQEQLDMRTLHRSRDQLVAERTALINRFDDRIGSKALSR